MTAREIVKARLLHQGTDETPYTLPMEGKIYESLTRYYKSNDWYQKKLKSYMASYCIIDTIQWTMLDETYATDAFGSVWRMDKEPWSLYKPVLSEQSFDGYHFPAIEKFTGSLHQNKAQIIAAHHADKENFTYISMGWGIFEHTWRMRGFEEALVDMVTDEHFYMTLCEKITDYYVEILRQCADVPADGVLFGDDWGDQRGLIMGAALWRKYFKPCWKRIYEEVHRQGKFTLGHSCGCISEIYDDLAEIGLDCHESVQPEPEKMKPQYIKEKWGNKMAFWGCLGSQSTLHFGTPDEIRDEIFRLRDLFRKDGGFILAPAKPLREDMSVQQAAAVVEAFADLNSK